MVNLTDLINILTSEEKTKLNKFLTRSNGNCRKKELLKIFLSNNNISDEQASLALSHLLHLENKWG